jgi:hypothetical protein
VTTNPKIELKARRDRREAAEALFAAMDRGGFDLDLEAIDRLNSPPRGEQDLSASV